MKNVKFFFVAILTVAFSASVFTLKAGDPVKSEVKTEQVSLEQLRAIYGENIQLDGDFDLENVAVVNFSTTGDPCADSPFGKCGPVAALSGINAQRLANDCCCNIIFGYECCDPSTGSDIAILAIKQPKQPCN